MTYLEVQTDTTMFCAEPQHVDASNRTSPLFCPTYVRCTWGISECCDKADPMTHCDMRKNAQEGSTGFCCN